MTKRYAVRIETAGGHCIFAATGLSKADATAKMRQIAEDDMREMGLDVSEIEDWRDGSLLAPGSIYSVTEQDAELDALLAERVARSLARDAEEWPWG